MDKNVIITGGTGGIGTALSKEFAKAGYKIFATHNNKPDEWLNNWLSKNELDQTIVEFVNCNLADRIQVSSVFNSLVQDNQFSVLVNNAGITADSSLLKMSYEQWENVLDVNLKSLFEITRIVANQMVTNKFGSIINISSVNGLKGQFGQTNYSAAKAGIIGFTKSLALELAKYSVCVNAIAPGYTRTPMVESMSTDILDKIINTVPIKRLIEPSEVAKAALFLSSGITAITGETISINGGLHLS